MKHHDITTGKQSPKHKALKNAVKLGVTSHFGPGRIRSSEETRSTLKPNQLRQYDRQKAEIAERNRK